MLLNAGASAININILSGDQSLFTRDISIGGNAYTEAVQKELNLPFDSAEQVKKGQPVEGVTFEDVKPVLHAMTENVLLEVQKTFDFFKATASSDRIDRIMLSGGASQGRRLRGRARGAVRRPRRGVRPVQDHRVRSAEAGGRGSRGAGGRRRRSRSASRSGRRATDDSHQPARRRARAGQEASCPFQAGQKLIAACSADPDPGRSLHRLALLALARESKELDAEISAAQQETRRLHSIIQQVQQFEQRKAQLQQRVVLIEQLRKGQTGPVHMLDQISRALPPMLWLTELKQAPTRTRS